MGRGPTHTGICVEYSVEIFLRVWSLHVDIQGHRIGMGMTYSNLSLHYVGGSYSSVFRGICA